MIIIIIIIIIIILKSPSPDTNANTSFQPHGFAECHVQDKLASATRLHQPSIAWGCPNRDWTGMQQVSVGHQNRETI